MPTMGYTHSRGEVPDDTRDIWMRPSTKEPTYDSTTELASERDSATCTYPGCGAGPGQLCVNPLTGRPARVPHMLHRDPHREPPVLGS
jgi:hypothetical protein